MLIAVARRGFTVLAYLDDFLIIESSKQQCQIAVDTLLDLLQSLGFTRNWSKVVQPSQSLCFLGVEMDTAVVKPAIEPAVAKTNK